MRTIERGGAYVRVADPDWENPLDGSYARDRGGRWNPSGSFPVVYLCASVEVARAIVYARLAEQPYRPEDLDPDGAPVLVETRVRRNRHVDVVTNRGCRSAGLPESYPLDGSGNPVPWRACQPIGAAARDEGAPGIACRTAAPTASAGEELAWFERRRGLVADRILAFDDWFW